jgi:shikimate kinase
VEKLTKRLDRPIVLVGLMGAGKSTVGRRLARRLGLPFVDTDAAIEDAAY